MTRGKIIVPGLNHPLGAPIQFRSMAHAQRHADNMRGKAMMPNPARRKGKKKARRR